MNTLDRDVFGEPGPQIQNAVVTDYDLTFYLVDGRRIVMPLWWSPKLQNAIPEQRQDFYILPIGDAVAWDDIDEHIGVRGVMLGGKPFPGAIPPPHVHVGTENVVPAE